MNIRKEYDYSALYAGINQAICANLSQMELYCALGRLICTRSEKGAAVAAAAYLTEEYPNQAGFSARNVRRMRDFYKIYANTPELLTQAMRLGWTQNVIILEADLTLEERAWYLQAAEQFSWSKLTLQKKISEDAHLTEFIALASVEHCEKKDVEATVISEKHKQVTADDLYAKGSVTRRDNTVLFYVKWNSIAKPRCIPWPRGEPAQPA